MHKNHVSLPFPHFSHQRFRAVIIFVLFLAFVLGALPASQAIPVQAAAAPGNGGFNYAEALQKALMFYEAQRSGHLSTSSIPTRFSWRGDSQLQDGMDNSIDLTGGWVDAGDNVKFGFPMTEAVSMIAWSAIEYRSAFVGSGQLKWVENELRWADDWFIKAHPSANVFYGQVGQGASDHSFWSPQEVTNLTNLPGPTDANQPTSRPSMSINTSCGGGADLAGGGAAALAASSIMFRPDDPTYADTLLTHATQLDAFAHANQQIYVKCITDAQGYYNSFSGFTDELVWSDIWLAKANEAKSAGSGSSYWSKAVTEYLNMPKVIGTTTPEYAWTLNWDDKSFGAYILMSIQFPNGSNGYNYNTDAERNLNYWLPGGGVTYTPGGHARLDQWGSMRYAMNASFLAFVYADHITDTTKQTNYRNFAEQQVNYVLGQNPRACSYEMGFGKCPPINPHHRTASGWWLGYVPSPLLPERHVLYGALSGSVGTDDSFTDDPTTYQSTEPAVDYNAGFIGALAKMYSLFGGTPLADSSFPLADNAHACKDEYDSFVNGSAVTNGTKLNVIVHNKSGWPSRVTYHLQTRYYFTLDSASISDVTVTGGGAGYAISGPTQFSGSVYYVTLDFSASVVRPGNGTWRSPGADVTITDAAGWNAANDWSWGGAGSTTPWDSTLTDTYNTANIYAANMPLYDSGTKLCGNEPGGGPTPTTGPSLTPSKTNTPVPTNTTGPTPTTGPTSTTPPTATTGPSATPSPIPPTKTNTPIPTTGPTNTPGSSALTVGIDKGGGTDNTQETTFNYQIKNTGTSAISSISTRIYFTTDGSNTGSGYTLEKYYDQSGVATISAPTLACGSTYYITVSYGTASLAAGASWEFQTALHLSSWGSTYSGANDWYHTGYAVGALPAAYTATSNIPAYVNGTLAAGSTPSCGGTAVPTNTFVPPTVTTVPPSATPIPPTKTNTPIPTNGPSATPLPPTATKTNTPIPTTGPTATKPPATNTPVPPTKTNTPVATSSGNCTPTSTITAPFTFDGAGTLCWKTNSLGSYINSWNLASLTINGVNITNVYVASGSYPAKASDGFWYIAYNSTVSFGHFETK